MLGKGWNLTALTRDPKSKAAKALLEKGVEIVQGDMEDASSLDGCLRGVYGVYSVQDFWSVGAKREVVQGKNLADAARKAGVEHFVYSSVGGAERNTGIGHWESKWEIEKHIHKLGLPATVLRPAAFMENYYVDQVEIGILQGNSMIPCAPTSRTRRSLRMTSADSSRWLSSGRRTSWALNWKSPAAS
jgi:uncharacterized protein YbjT (DUF2867 family)